MKNVQRVFFTMGLCLCRRFLVIEKLCRSGDNFQNGKRFCYGDHPVQITGNGEVSFLGNNPAPRYGNNREIGSFIAQLEDGLQTVFDRHDHIGYNQIAGLSAKKCHPIQTVGRCLDLISLTFENSPQDIKG